MKNNSRNILIAFVTGQVIQLAMFAVATLLNIGNSLLWAASAGIILTMAIMAGMVITIFDYAPASKRAGDHEKAVSK